MKENLKVTKYRNGESIPNITDNKEWVSLIEGAFCWMNNDSTVRENSYGALYNWYAAVDPRKICPTGWHVPTDAEWQVMERFLGMTFTEAEGTVIRGDSQVQIAHIFLVFLPAFDMPHQANSLIWGLMPAGGHPQKKIHTGHGFGICTITIRVFTGFLIQKTLDSVSGV
jgi:hypothetical protein